VGVSFDMACVDHQQLKIGIIDQFFKKRFPNPLIFSATKASVCIFPISVIRRQVSPGSASAQNPKNRIYELAIVLGNPFPAPCSSWEKWL